MNTCARHRCYRETTGVLKLNGYNGGIHPPGVQLAAEPCAKPQAFGNVQCEHSNCMCCPSQNRERARHLAAPLSAASLHSEGSAIANIHAHHRGRRSQDAALWRGQTTCRCWYQSRSRWTGCCGCWQLTAEPVMVIMCKYVVTVRS